MNSCSNCGRKVNKSSGFCPNCGSRITTDHKNISPAPNSRVEKKKSRSKNKKIVAVGSIVGMLAVVSVTPFVVKGLQKPVTKTSVTAAKKIDPSTEKATENKSESSNLSPESSKPSSSDYIVPTSNKRLLSLDDIDILPKWQLRLARNEIYARHGYVFKSKDLQTYFSGKSWYHPNPSFDGSLNDVERQNVTTIKAREDSL
ncbi:YARHG domain-containing protein [Neobacillus cucumis]|uniref:YARHG domain-containing protein n=1 Tax=Neobacillus cucumis TaxID=1740721 RepID=UPI0018DF5DFA|nr:YARHG domain-containing protein [Neobacillus cucumis]MBI0581293.1 YARHG domain-containing protein [Neobacillus cucumis]